MANPAISPHIEPSREYVESSIDMIAVSSEQPAYVDWSAVLAGTAIAFAMSLLLYGFGAAVGLYVAQPWTNSEATTTTISIAMLIFVALAYIYSLALGSYFAGRMRPRHSFNSEEAQFRDGANGLVVWAIALILGAVIAGNVLVGTVERVATAGYRTAAGVSSAIAPFAETAVDNMLRRATTSGPETAGGAAAGPPREAAPGETTGAAPDSPAAPTGTPDVTTRTAAPASNAATSAPTTGNSFTTQQLEQIGRIVSRSLSAGTVSDNDQQYLANVLETNFGYTPEQALTTVNQQMEQSIQETKAYLTAAKENTAFAGFWSAVVVLLSGLACWWAATLGGTHRDEAANQTETSTLMGT